MAARSNPRNRTPNISGVTVTGNVGKSGDPTVGFTLPVIGHVQEPLTHLIEGFLGGATIVGAGATAGGGAAAGAGAAEAGAGTTAAAGAGSSTGAAVGSGAAGGAFSKAAGAINSPLDFLLLVAWLFNPRMILRAVEFLVGLALMIFGFHAALQSRGERMEGFSTSESPLTRSGLGRVATELGRASRSGQRPSRPQSAPHATRRKALRQRYQREEDLQRRRASAPRPSR